ncbi:DNA/RNA non-specific endonuclease [Pusillimonas sp. NJUB218]|uniref:DNA/RNA non-specific endonuclease n=1 Tax=Pusillimonas sp. NJUB218 TaxID=2023230 RepID=UPI000F4BA745|nr:DNA/RNA non-specific endonuclease [Pusillimonas sp. NJUB218]ROT45153.1 endonuclease [Pusillimonas sp. NJUB218]
MATRRRIKRTPQKGRRFKLLLTSTAASFAFFTALFNPQLADLVGLEHVDIGRVATAVASQPPVAAKSGLVQTSFKDCPQFFPGKPPAVPAAPRLRELCYSSFAILHSGQTKTPVFVAQRLNRQMLEQAQSVQRQDRFYEEGRLPSADRARLDDYKGSGYARGHMAPAGDMHTPEAMAQSFSLANMVPQDQRQNSGPWNKIEQDTRKYIMRAKGDVYVFTGPVYADRSERIGTGQVAVPTHLFKVVYDATTKRSWVHWQENGPEARAGRPIAYEEFVRRVGLMALLQM